MAHASFGVFGRIRPLRLVITKDGRSGGRRAAGANGCSPPPPGLRRATNVSSIQLIVVTLKVYLDLCKWRDLAHAAAGDRLGEPFREALTVARASVDMGLATFPLSAEHYMETQARNRYADRKQLAHVMLELSRGGVMAGLEQLVPCEVDHALKALFGRPLVPRSTQVFGLSIFQALGQSEWTIPIADQLTPLQHKAVEQVAQYFLLAGPPDGVSVPGLDRQAYRGPGHDFAQRQRELAQTLCGVSSGKRRDILIARRIMDIWVPIEEALRRAGIERTELTSLGRDGLTDFLQGVPSRWTEVEMLYQHYANPQLVWQENDLVDLVTMCIALVYCDVIVAEKFWVDMAHRAGLDRLYGATLLTNVGELPSVLIEASTPS